MACSAWPLLGGIFCEDPIVEEALMLPHSDFCVAGNVANSSPGLLQRAHLTLLTPEVGLWWLRPLVTVIAQVGPGMFVPMMGSHWVDLVATNIFPLSALYLFPDPACW